MLVAHAWVLLSLYLCAAAGVGPVMAIPMPDERACVRLLARLQADQRSADMPDSVPGTLACRPQMASRGATECYGDANRP